MYDCETEPVVKKDPNLRIFTKVSLKNNNKMPKKAKEEAEWVDDEVTAAPGKGYMFFVRLAAS